MSKITDENSCNDYENYKEVELYNSNTNEECDLTSISLLEIQKFIDEKIKEIPDEYINSAEFVTESDTYHSGYDGDSFTTSNIIIKYWVPKTKEDFDNEIKEKSGYEYERKYKEVKNIECILEQYLQGDELINTMKDVYSKILFNCKPEVDLEIKDMKKFEKDLWDIYEN